MSEKLLIVEDDKKLNDGIRLALKNDAYFFYQCRTLQEAREILKKEDITLVLLDVNLPDGNGIDFVREIRKNSQVPIILLTVNNMEVDIVTGLEAGAKKKRQNNTLDAFAASFIKGVLDNPVYCGKLAYGRRKNEKVSGTRNEYRIVKQENYMLHDGIHEGIISETDWELAHQKREKTGVKYEKTHSLDHEHILSGILRCPLCGSGMYGNVNRKKKKDGTLYKDYFYYACKHRRLVDGHKCGYRKQWSEEKINNAVEEVIRKLVKNPKFEEAILNKIGSRIDTEEIEKEIERLEKQHRQLTGAKGRLGQQMDSLDIMDKFYEKKYQDMETRLYHLYDEIEGVENSIEEVKNRLLNIRQQKISEENVYQFLLYFDKLYDKFTDLEKKEFLNSFVEQVDIYEQEQPDGRFLKHIKFRFPVYFGDRETQELCWDNESTVETCVLLSKLG